MIPPNPAPTGSSGSSDATENADALRVPGPGSLDGGQPPGLVREVAGRDPGSWVPASPGEAEAALRGIAAFCGRKCPIVDRCAGQECRLYRLETIAKTFLDAQGPSERVGVVGQETIGL